MGVDLDSCSSSFSAKIGLFSAGTNRSCNFSVVCCGVVFCSTFDEVEKETACMSPQWFNTACIMKYEKQIMQ